VLPVDTFQSHPTAAARLRVLLGVGLESFGDRPDIGLRLARQYRKRQCDTTHGWPPFAPISGLLPYAAAVMLGSAAEGPQPYRHTEALPQLIGLHLGARSPATDACSAVAAGVLP
jgi:hypothetical protein